MTMKFAPHVRHVADQWRKPRETQADREYALYTDGLQRIEAELQMVIPAIPREEFEDMRELLAARRGVTV
jgi:hypothetical protein